MKIFVSYRRADVGGYAGRLTDALIQRLGADKVFHDVEAIGPGRDFTREIDAALSGSDAILAVIGPGWIQASSSDGQRRLWQSDDFVRAELVKGLTSGVPVVPVLVGGASMPTAQDLPSELFKLADRQAVTLHDDAFHYDVDRLISSLRGSRARRGSGHPRRWIAVVIAAGVLAAGAATWVIQSRDQTEQTSSTRPNPCPDSSTADWVAVTVAGKPSTVLSDTAGSVTVTFTAAKFQAVAPDTWLLVLKAQLLNNTSERRYLDESNFRTAEVAQRPFEPSTCSTFPNRDTAPGQIVDGWVGFDVNCRPDSSVAVILQTGTTDQRTRVPITSGPPSAECQNGGNP